MKRVMAVDGDAVRERERHFMDLVGNPAAEVIAMARRLAEESARYNLGRLVRTTNTPTTARAGTLLPAGYVGRNFTSGRVRRPEL